MCRHNADCVAFQMMSLEVPVVETSWLTVRRYRVIAWVAFASLYVIIITGSLVRLTGSGLGCVDWPACNEERFVDVSSPHAAIEQVNRLFTGVVAASVIAAMAAAFVVRPRSARLVRLAGLMVLGVLGQVVLGGIVVLTGLHPLSNMGHFLLSIVLMTWAFWLVRGISSTSSKAHPPIDSWSMLVSRRGWSLGSETRVAALARYVLILTSIAIVTGTVVTGSGPHAGDELARRFDLPLTVAARFHGLAVIATVVAALCMGLALRRQTRQQRHITVAWEIFLLSAILQGGLGYWQYFTGVPIVLVAIHIAGSVAVWLAALNLVSQAQIKAIAG